MHHRFAIMLGIVGGVMGAGQAAAQETVIPGALPRLVITDVEAQVTPQRFQLTKADDKEAVFTRDDGVVAQANNSPVPYLRVYTELHLNFKPTPKGLDVRASEVIVGGPNSPIQIHKPVYTNRKNLQRLLDAIHAEIDPASARPDSGGGVD